MADFVIPDHWKKASELASVVLNDFKQKVVLDDFLTWDRYKKYEYIIFDDNRIYIVVRHTKKWLSVCDECANDDGSIRINIDDNSLEKKDSESFYRLLYCALAHELIHYFQRILRLEDNLSDDEKRKLYLHGNGFNSSRNIFLYETNWIEMDAELGSYFILHDFKVPTLNELIRYYHEWYSKIELATMIATYVYNYFISGKKNVAYRNSVFDRKTYLKF